MKEFTGVVKASTGQDPCRINIDELVGVFVVKDGDGEAAVALMVGAELTSARLDPDEARRVAHLLEEAASAVEAASGVVVEDEGSFILPDRGMS